MAKMANKNGRTNFDKVLALVREKPGDVFDKYARMLSDLSLEKAERLRGVLADLPKEQRTAFYRAMDETSLNSFEYNYAPIAEFGMEDPEGEVRRASIHVLGLEDSRGIGARLLKAAQDDPYDPARIAAIEVLGQYMFEAELDNRIPVSKNLLTETLENLIEHKNQAIRRAAVVAFAISESKRVKEIISGYLAGNNKEELIAGLSAVRHAMGEDWDDTVLELIRDEDEDVSREAVRTAGELRLKEALPALYEILSRFDRISPEMLVAAAEAVAEIGDEDSLDVLETLGEAVVDMDDEITEAVDDAIDTLNMAIYIGADEDDEEQEHKAPAHVRASLRQAIDTARDQCLTILEEKIPHDLEDDEPIDIDMDEEDEECECGEHHHHHHHHHHDNPLEGMALSRFRILDDLEAYESAAAHDADEEELWAEFEEMAEEDLDAESLQEFINKLEQKRRKK